MAELVLETASEAASESLAAQLGARLHAGLVITLSGDLGAGKTVFVRGLARGLELPPRTVTSPTYVLQHIYQGGRLTLYHIDAYRLGGGSEEFEASGLGESLADPEGVVCIEWPEYLKNFFWPSDRLMIRIEHIDIERRRFTLQASGPKSQALLKGIG